MIILAILLATVALFIAARCLMRNFDPARVKAGSVIAHVIMVVPMLFGSGMCYTASKTSPGASFGRVLGFGWGLSTAFALIGTVICVAPAILAMIQRRNDARDTAEFDAHLRRHYMVPGQPWSLKSAEPAKPQQAVGPAASWSGVDIATLNVKPEPVAQELDLTTRSRQVSVPS